MAQKKVKSIDTVIKDTADRSRAVVHKALKGTIENKGIPHPKPNPSDAFLILSAVFTVILVFGILSILPEPYTRMLELLVVSVAAYYLYKNYREGKL